MKNCLWIQVIISGFSLLLCRFAFCAQQNIENIHLDFSEEPAELFVLAVDDEKFLLNADKAQHVQIAGKKRSVEVSKQSYRVFPYGGITFYYPSEYRYAYKSHGVLKIWDLSGEYCRLMLQRYPKQDEKILLKNFAQELSKDYGEKKAQISSQHLTLNQHELDGQHFVIMIAHHEVIQDVYALAGEKNVFILVLQRNAVVGKDEVLQAEKEMHHLVALLDESLRV